MDIMKQFEYPLPAISCDINSLNIEISKLGTSGFFNIKNKGGGVLNGQVMSHNPIISLEPSEFKENANNISYKIDVNFYKIGDTVETEIVVLSNGGELVIPVFIKIVPIGLKTIDGSFVFNIEDFLNYSSENMNTGDCIQLFLSSEFKNWLLGVSPQNYDIYLELVKDTNKTRALDNFLIMLRGEIEEQLHNDNGKLIDKQSKKSLIKININKYAFSNNEVGHIDIVNDTGKEVEVFVNSDSNFIKLTSKTSKVSKLTRLDFNIKFSPFHTAQMAIMKQPFSKGEISVKVIVDRKSVEKVFIITAGVSFI